MARLRPHGRPRRAMGGGPGRPARRGRTTASPSSGAARHRGAASAAAAARPRRCSSARPAPARPRHARPALLRRRCHRRGGAPGRCGGRAEAAPARRSAGPAGGRREPRPSPGRSCGGRRNGAPTGLDRRSGVGAARSSRSPAATAVPGRGQIVAVWGPPAPPAARRRGRDRGRGRAARRADAAGRRRPVRRRDRPGARPARRVAPGWPGLPRRGQGRSTCRPRRSSRRLGPRLRVLTGIVRADRWPELRPAAVLRRSGAGPAPGRDHGRGLRFQPRTGRGTRRTTPWRRVATAPRSRRWSPPTRSSAWAPQTRSECSAWCVASPSCARFPA